MKTIADVLGVARSHLHELVHRPTAQRHHYRKATDEFRLLPPEPQACAACTFSSFLRTKRGPLRPSPCSCCPKERLSPSDRLYRFALNIQNVERAAWRVVIEYGDHQPPSIPSEGVKVGSVLF
jgi:hypothetical protein